jgi:hypothetical protein
MGGEKLEEIGGQFGMGKYSSVSSAIGKMKRGIGKPQAEVACERHGKHIKQQSTANLIPSR